MPSAKAPSPMAGQTKLLSFFKTPKAASDPAAGIPAAATPLGVAGKMAAAPEAVQRRTAKAVDHPAPAGSPPSRASAPPEAVKIPLSGTGTAPSAALKERGPPSTAAPSAPASSSNGTPRKATGGTGKAAKKGSKRKGGKASADPTKPKRPKTAYLLFCDAHRPSLAAQEPKPAPKDILRQLAQRWKGASPEERAAYEGPAKELREAFIASKTAWMRRDSDAENAPPGPSGNATAMEVEDVVIREEVDDKPTAGEGAAFIGGAATVPAAGQGLCVHVAGASEAPGRAAAAALETPSQEATPSEAGSLVGLGVLKAFGAEGDFAGRITHVTQDEPCYLHVVYDDGDREDVTLEEARLIVGRHAAAVGDNAAPMDSSDEVRGPACPAVEVAFAAEVAGAAGAAEAAKAIGTVAPSKQSECAELGAAHPFPSANASPATQPIAVAASPAPFQAPRQISANEDLKTLDDEEDLMDVELPQPLHAHRKSKAATAPAGPVSKPRRTAEPDEDFEVGSDEGAEEDAKAEAAMILDDPSDDEAEDSRLPDVRHRLEAACARPSREEESDFHRGVIKPAAELFAELPLGNGEVPAALDRVLARLIQGGRGTRDTVVEEALAQLGALPGAPADLAAALPTAMLADRMVLLAERRSYGPRPRKASEWNDESATSLWCWEVDKKSAALLAIGDKDLKALRKTRTEAGKKVKLLAHLLKELEKLEVDDAKVTQLEENVAKLRRQAKRTGAAKVQSTAAAAPATSGLLGFFGKQPAKPKAASLVRTKAAAAAVVDLSCEDAGAAAPPASKAAPKPRAKFAPRREVRSALRHAPLDYAARLRAAQTPFDDLSPSFRASKRQGRRRRKVELLVKVRRRAQLQEAPVEPQVDYGAAVIDWGRNDALYSEPVAAAEPVAQGAAEETTVVDVDAPAGSSGKSSVLETKRLDGRMRLLQFHEDERPAYHGTISRRLGNRVSGRNPLGVDAKALNYQYDSGEDWEDEGEGEDLSDTDGEEEADTHNDLDYDDGWLRYDDDLGSDVDMDDLPESDDETQAPEDSAALDTVGVDVGGAAGAAFDPRAPATKKRKRRPLTASERLAKASSRQQKRGLVAGPHFSLSPLRVSGAADEAATLLAAFPVVVLYEPPETAAPAGSITGAPASAEGGSTEAAPMAALFQTRSWCPHPAPLEDSWSDRRLDAGNRAEDDAALAVEDLCAGRTSLLMEEDDVGLLAQFSHRRIAKVSALVDDFLAAHAEVKVARKVVKEVLTDIAQKDPDTDEWVVRKKLRRRFELPTAQEEEYADMRAEWQSKQGKLSGRRAASRHEVESAERPPDAIAYEDTGAAYIKFSDAWKTILRKNGWNWKNGSGLMSYVYVRTGGRTPARGGVEGDDWFADEAASAHYLRNLDEATLRRDLPLLLAWREEARAAAMESEDEAATRDQQDSVSPLPAPAPKKRPSQATDVSGLKRHKVQDPRRSDDGGWLEHKESMA